MKLASRADLPALSRLWARCFDDLPARVDDFWDLLYDEIRVFTNDDLTAMAVGMPMRWQAREAVYFYAVCTAPEARGGGLCRTLLSEAEDALRRQGISYALLVPAKESLFSFYEKLGYQTLFYHDSRTYTNISPSVPPKRISPARYGELRARFLTNSVEHPLCLLKLQASGGGLYELPCGGCAAAELDDDGFFIRELLTDDPDAAVRMLAAELDQETLLVYTPGASPHGMAKSLDGSPLCPSYLGLSFG